ncbi:hypothetical protein [Sphingomicrobium arenosum]|uniref:hypothetical protein n=1 Tax=Sphingomicrobium arenosum TaxID=2233861 RepID=UPI0022410492|nr:hypothetical protein [Sphingomicrobium arenosum]
MILAALLLAAEPGPATAVEAERAFAADALDHGQWQAFATWAAEDAVLVGRTVVGARALATVLAAQGEPEQAIRWWPTLGITSCDGAFAINSGPYVDPGSNGVGRFHTGWRKGEEGWRYILDMGMEADAPVTGPVESPAIACTDLPAYEPPITFEAERASGGIAMSPDASLKWEWRIGQWDDEMAPHRLFRAWAWDGAAYAPLIETLRPIADGSGNRTVSAVQAEVAMAALAEHAGQWAALDAFGDDETVMLASTIQNIRKRAAHDAALPEPPPPAPRWWPLESHVSCDSTLALNTSGWRMHDGGYGLLYTLWTRPDTAAGWTLEAIVPANGEPGAPGNLPDPVVAACQGTPPPVEPRSLAPVEERQFASADGTMTVVWSYELMQPIPRLHVHQWDGTTRALTLDIRVQ